MSIVTAEKTVATNGPVALRDTGLMYMPQAQDEKREEMNADEHISNQNFLRTEATRNNEHQAKSDAVVVAVVVMVCLSFIAVLFGIDGILR